MQSIVYGTFRGRQSVDLCTIPLFFSSEKGRTVRNALSRTGKNSQWPEGIISSEWTKRYAVVSLSVDVAITDTSAEILPANFMK